MVLFLVVLLLSSAPGEADSAAGAHEGEGETSTNELAAVEHEERSILPCTRRSSRLLLPRR